MADKTLGITVTGDIDDISTKLDSLLDQLNLLQDQTLELTVNADSSSLDEVSSASETLTNDLESAGDAANSVGSDIKTIDSTALSEAASHSTALGTSFNTASTEAREMEKTVDSATSNVEEGLKAVAGAAAAIGGYLVIDNLASSAGNFEDSWSRMNIAMGGTVGSINTTKGEWSGAISEMVDDTGRGAGTIREFVTQMGLRGVDSAAVIESSFEGIAGAAYVTGLSIDTVSGSFERIVTTGKVRAQQLTALGLTTDDIGMSVTDLNSKLEGMDATSRAAYLGMLLNQKYAKEGNEAFKQSWEGLGTALSRAKEYLSVTLGELILPILIPAIKTTTDLLKGLAGWIGSLDPISKGFLGTVLLMGGAFITIGGAITAALALYNALQLRIIFVTAAKWLEIDATNKSSLALVREIIATTASNIAKDAQILIMNASILARQIYNAEIWTTIGAYAKEIGVKAAYVVASAAQTAATVAVTAAQYALNLAMSLNPIGIVVIAITALVLALGYLYYNNEQVRNSINGLWASIQGFGAYLQESFVNALNTPGKVFQDFIDDIENIGSGLYDAGRSWIGDLVQGIEDSIPSLDDILQQISDYFPHSPPKTGPLSNVTEENMYGYGESLGKSFNSGLKAGTTSAGMNLEDPNTFNLGNMAAAIADPTTLLKAEQERKQVVDTQAAEKKKQDAVSETVRKAFTDLESLDQKAKATTDSMAYSAMTNAQKIQYNFELATHNTIANFYAMEEAAKASMSRMSDMLGKMNISLPGITYTPGEMLNQRNQTLQDLNKQRNALTQAGPKAFGKDPDVTEPGDLQAYQNAIKDIDNQIKQLGKGSVVSDIAKSGQSVGQSWGNGVASGIASSQSNINKAIGSASMGMIANSPPKEGPLKDVDKYGLSIGKTFTENLAMGISNVTDMLSLNSLPSSTPLPSSTSLQQNTGGATINFTGPITVPEGSDPVAVGRDLGKGAHDGWTSRVVDQAGKAGFSIPNQIRG